MGETYGDVVVEEFWSEDFIGAVEDTQCYINEGRAAHS